MKHKRPFVVATFAMTVDGKVTTKNLSPVDFTSREDKLHLFRQRALADAVLIGHTSLKRDNVRLGLPAEMQESQNETRSKPLPITRDRFQRRQDRPSSEDFSVGHFADHHFFYETNASKILSGLWRRKRHSILSDTKNVDLAGMLQTLRNKYKVRTVACEGGPTLFRALLEQGLIDQLNLTIAPYMFGGAKAPTLTGVSKDFLPASVHCSLSDMRTIGDECFLTYRIKHQRRRRN